MTTEELSTIEGITETAKKYYEWTDSLTEEQNDGKAFIWKGCICKLYAGRI